MQNFVFAFLLISFNIFSYEAEGYLHQAYLHENITQEKPATVTTTTTTVSHPATEEIKPPAVVTSSTTTTVQPHATTNIPANEAYATYVQSVQPASVSEVIQHPLATTTATTHEPTPSTHVILPEEKINQETIHGELKSKDVSQKLNTQSKEIKKEKKVLKTAKETEDQKKERAVISSLDTLGVEDEGNWLLKRVWWEQAELTFEKIIEVNDKVIQEQTNYFNSRKAFDKEIAAAFKQLGFEQAQIDQIVGQLLERLTTQTSTEVITDEESELINAISVKKSQLENIRQNFESLAKFEGSIDEVLTQLSNQVNLTRDYEKHSWDNFKEIGRILNDKQAKVLFYKIDANLKNVQNILSYLKNDLRKYYNGILENAKKISGSVAATIDALNKEGINLKEQYQRLQKLEEQRQLDKQKMQQRKKNKGWFEAIGDFFMAPINWVKSFFKK